MADKHKYQKDVSKKSRGEKTQRNVTVVKHFQPNVTCNKLHRNCDLPEVNADIETIDKFAKTRKLLVLQAAQKQNKHSRSSSITRTNSSNIKVGKPLNIHLTSLLCKSNIENKFKSVTKDSLSSGSSTAREFIIPPKPKKSSSTIVRTNKHDKLIKPPFKFSVKSSSTTSKENEPTKVKKFQAKKSKSFSVGSRQQEKKVSRSKFVSVSGADMDKTVEDLRKEIHANQTKHYKPNERNCDSAGARRERVEKLRDEIKKLIENNLNDKRKYLTELTTEIAEYRSNKNVLVYNVNTENIDEKKPKEDDVETLFVNTHPVDELLMKSTENFYSLPEESHEMKIQGAVPGLHTAFMGDIRSDDR
ncbi:hypothetical protein JTB14_027602 [Gonioctena quinquepunctata]|nr:hypothetical protein JTB14_027602 [Gonioctena quinquepunctata]